MNSLFHHLSPPSTNNNTYVTFHFTVWLEVRFTCMFPVLDGTGIRE